MQAVLEHPFLKRAVDATQLQLNTIQQQNAETQQQLSTIEQQNAETHQSLESLHGKVDAYRPPMDPLWTPMDPPLGPSYTTRWTP